MIIYTIIILCVLIFVHEFGHFIAAKLLGVKVNQFALGMGPAFWKKQWGETEYSLRIFPIGGFCAMEGEDEDSEDERAFNKRPAWAKAIILVAGVTMNVLLALIIMTGVMLYVGSASTTIGAVSAGSPAETAGLQVGDELLYIDDTKIEEWSDVSEAVTNAEDGDVTIQVKRGSDTVLMTSELTQSEDGRSVIGITCKVRHNIFIALGQGAKSSIYMVKSLYQVIIQLFTGEVAVSELSGPVGIAYMVDATADMGILYLLYFVAFFSMNLAVMNLLPLPALDGGRLFFLVVRLITRGRFSDEVEAKINFIGIMLLFVLMIYVTWQDIGRFILGDFKIG